MTGKIYLLQDNGSLQAMSERSYVTEERLQLLLKDYPDLLAGDQMDEQNPRRWLLVSREVGVPIEEGGTDWMSLDHLFLDQDAVPTELCQDTGTSVQPRPTPASRRPLPANVGWLSMAAGDLVSGLGGFNESFIHM
jgi:hypothetical protein